jgi:hypothetical protein
MPQAMGGNVEVLVWWQMGVGLPGNAFQDQKRLRAVEPLAPPGRKQGPGTSPRFPRHSSSTSRCCRWMGMNFCTWPPLRRTCPNPCSHRSGLRKGICSPSGPDDMGASPPDPSPALHAPGAGVWSHARADSCPQDAPCPQWSAAAGLSRARRHMDAHGGTAGHRSPPPPTPWPAVGQDPGWSGAVGTPDGCAPWW